MSRTVLWILLVTLVAAHIAIVVGNVAAFLVLPFLAPWYVALPLCTWVWTLATTDNFTCRLTQWENLLRRQLGLREVRSFIGHYFMKHLYVLLGVPKKDSATPGN